MPAMSARNLNKSGQRSRAQNVKRAPAVRPPSALAAAEKVNILSALTKSEQKELRQCEAVIAQGWLTFLQVGRALQRIRDAQLYRYGYRAFADYCRDKWKLGHTHAYRLIGAAQVMAILSPIGDIPIPTHESQVRPLLGLESDVARAAWVKAIESAQGRTVTARDVRRAVLEVTGSSIPHSRPPRSGHVFSQILDLLGDVEQALDQSKPPSEIKDRVSQARALLLQISSGGERGVRTSDAKS